MSVRFCYLALHFRSQLLSKIPCFHSPLIHSRLLLLLLFTPSIALFSKPCFGDSTPPTHSHAVPCSVLPDLGNKQAKMFDQMHKKSNTSSTTTANTSTGSESPQIKKICSDCGTNRTPLWRGGPAGPKSLCNACGIRSRKRRRALLGITDPEIKKNPNNNKSMKVTVSTRLGIDDGSNYGGSSSSTTTSEISGDGKMRCDHVMKMEGLTWDGSTAVKKWRRGVVLGEEEQAAVLLMAMAYSYVLV